MKIVSMTTRSRLFSVALALVIPFAVFELAGLFGVEGSSSSSWSSSESDPTVTWIAVRSDNICGLDDPRFLSRPARVHYHEVLARTREMRKIKEDKIDPASPEGIQLRQGAVDRVRRAAELVRKAEGYCSVWKHINHRDGREIDDVSEKVIELLDQVMPGHGRDAPIRS